MGTTKFFTEQVPGGSRRGEASDEEDMQRRITDFGAEEILDDSTFFMPEGGGGFVGRGKGWEGDQGGVSEMPLVRARVAVIRAASSSASGLGKPASNSKTPARSSYQCAMDGSTKGL